MSSGLIWAGIGKGIADAGSAIGQSMWKDAAQDEAERKEAQREAALMRREERRAFLKEEFDRQRAAREEEDRAAMANAISQRAGDAAINRDAAALAKTGFRTDENSETAMTQKDIAKLLKEQPDLRDTYKSTGLIGADKIDPRLQRANDEEQAARELGAKATIVESYAKAKKAVLDQITQENKDEQTNRRLDQGEERLNQYGRKLDQQGELIGAKIDRMANQNMTDKQNADSRTTQANKPSGRGGSSGDKPPTGIDLERNAKAAEKALALELGVPVKDVPETVARLRKQNKLTPEAQDKLDSYNSALSRWQNYKSDRPSSDSAPAPSPRNSGNNRSSQTKQNYSNLWN